MLLAIDIGNTNITFGVCDKNRIIKRFDLPGGAFSLAGLNRKIGRISVTGAAICSVVPPLTETVKNNIKKGLGIKPYIIGKDMPIPVKNRYRKPSQVGCDRLVNAYAAIILYGAPLISIDFGTAITFDVVSRNKEYLGGMILPGLNISLEALYQKTALLPKTRLHKPPEFIGRETKNSILSGIIYGFACMTDQLIERIREKIGKNATAIGTGGNITLIKTYCRKLNIIDRDLTLKGISLIYNHAHTRPSRQ